MQLARQGMGNISPAVLPELLSTKVSCQPAALAFNESPAGMAIKELVNVGVTIAISLGLRELDVLYRISAKAADI